MTTFGWIFWGTIIGIIIISLILRFKETKTPNKTGNEIRAEEDVRRIDKSNIGPGGGGF